MKTPKYGDNVIVIKEKWTRKGGRYEVKHFNGKDSFEFGDSSERADQRRNALLWAQQLLTSGDLYAQQLLVGGNLYAVLHEEGREPTARVEAIFIDGHLRENWK